MKYIPLALGVTGIAAVGLFMHFSPETIIPEPVTGIVLFVLGGGLLQYAISSIKEGSITVAPQSILKSQQPVLFFLAVTTHCIFAVVVIAVGIYKILTAFL